MRSGLTLVVAGIIASLVTGASEAAFAGTTVRGGGNTIVGSGSDQGGASSGSAPYVGGSLPPGSVVVQVPTIVGPGQYCLVSTVVPAGTVLPPFNPISTLTAVPCPGAATPPPPTAAQITQQWAKSAHLPPPVLTIRPGYAVTGLTAYLEIAAHTPWTTTFADPIRLDTITASCSDTEFDVDWGDGAHTATASPGGAYPSGDVTHVYQQASAHITLGVTEQWSCAWSDQVGDAGTIVGLASASSLALEVREIQTPTAS
jgi:hypothetical protein